MAAESLSLQLNYVSMHLHSNIQRLQYIISTASTTAGIEVLLSLYAKKARLLGEFQFGSEIYFLDEASLLLLTNNQYIPFCYPAEPTVEALATLLKTTTYFQGIYIGLMSTCGLPRMWMTCCSI